MATSQHGGGLTSGGQGVIEPMIQPWCCSTRYCGEAKSLLETGPMRSQNCWGLVNASEPAIRVAARRRVKKSRGVHAVSAQSVARMKTRFCINEGGVCLIADLRL